jgi:hypothetical protein
MKARISNHNVPEIKTVLLTAAEKEKKPIPADGKLKTLGIAPHRTA